MASQNNSHPSTSGRSAGNDPAPITDAFNQNLSLKATATAAAAAISHENTVFNVKGKATVVIGPEDLLLKATATAAAAAISHENTVFNLNGIETIVIEPEDIEASTRDQSVQIVPPITGGTSIDNMLKVDLEQQKQLQVPMSYSVSSGPSNGGDSVPPPSVSNPWPLASESSPNKDSALDVSAFPTLGTHKNHKKEPSHQQQPNQPEPYSAEKMEQSYAAKKRTFDSDSVRETASRRNKSGNPITHFGSGSRIPTDASVSSGQPALTLTLRSKNYQQDGPHYDNVPASVSSLNAAAEPASLLDFLPGTRLEIGSMINVATDVLDILHGVIKWIGVPAGQTTPLVGVELEDALHDTPLDVTNGSYRGRQLFKCPPARGLFVAADQCSADTRFGDPAENDMWQEADGGASAFQGDTRKQFGDVDCPIVEGTHGPMSIMDYDHLQTICGKFRGIQGHHNSCYLDATLFSMFAFSRVCDAVLYRPANDASDIGEYGDIQRVLRDEIVNPLRISQFVRADRVLGLRRMLESVCSAQGLTTEEKDPEEFLNILLAQALKASPFLRLSSGQAAFCYQLFVDRDERLQFPSVQQLFDQSFLSSNIKLQSVPNCLIVQMPRFGKDYKTYPRILPSLVLDVTDVIENSPRTCHICGSLAELECKDCFQYDSTLDKITFCCMCFPTLEQHKKPADGAHQPLELHVMPDFHEFGNPGAVPRVYMDLFAVVCIETSHYVSFAKTGAGAQAPWCFFDSMADRQGGQLGCNIPELQPVVDLPQWISETGAQKLHERAKNDKQLPKLAKRLLCDAYLCMYQQRDVLMYQ